MLGQCPASFACPRSHHFTSGSRALVKSSSAAGLRFNLRYVTNMSRERSMRLPSNCPMAKRPEVISLLMASGATASAAPTVASSSATGVNFSTVWAPSPACPFSPVCPRIFDAAYARADEATQRIGILLDRLIAGKDGERIGVDAVVRIGESLQLVTLRCSLHLQSLLVPARQRQGVHAAGNQGRAHRAAIHHDPFDGVDRYTRTLGHDRPQHLV